MFTEVRDSAEYFGSLPMDQHGNSSELVNSKTKLRVSKFQDMETMNNLVQCLSDTVGETDIVIEPPSPGITGYILVDCNTDSTIRVIQQKVKRFAKRMHCPLAVERTTETDPRNVFVPNLPDEFTESKLHETFESYGKVIFACVLRSSFGRAGRFRLVGFVRFREARDALKAIKEYNEHNEGRPERYCRLANVSSSQRRAAKLKDVAYIQYQQIKQGCTRSASDTSNLEVSQFAMNHPPLEINANSSASLCSYNDSSHVATAAPQIPVHTTPFAPVNWPVPFEATQTPQIDAFQNALAICSGHGGSGWPTWSWVFNAGIYWYCQPQVLMLLPTVQSNPAAALITPAIELELLNSNVPTADNTDIVLATETKSTVLQTVVNSEAESHSKILEDGDLEAFKRASLHQHGTVRQGKSTGLKRAP